MPRLKRRCSKTFLPFLVVCTVTIQIVIITWLIGHYKFRKVDAENGLSELDITTYWPNEEPILSNPSVQEQIELIEAKCDSRLEWNTKTNVQHDIVLIITFNYKIYTIVPLLALLHSKAFNRIVFCGQGEDRPDLPIVFVSIPDVDATTHYRGAFLYECIIKTHHLQLPNVTGYLLIGDDTFLNPSLTRFLPKQKIWTLGPPKVFDLVKEQSIRKDSEESDEYYVDDWTWNDYYRERIVNTLESLLNQTTTDGDAKTCTKTLEDRNGGLYRYNYLAGTGDILYLPAKKAATFSIISRAFLANEVFAEIAIPTVIQCITSPEEVHYLHHKDSSLWYDGKRRHALKFLSPDKQYLHPIKLSPFTPQKQSTAFTPFKQELWSLFCQKLLPLYWST